MAHAHGSPAVGARRLLGPNSGRQRRAARSGARRSRVPRAVRSSGGRVAPLRRRRGENGVLHIPFAGRGAQGAGGSCRPSLRLGHCRRGAPHHGGGRRGPQGEFPALSPSDGRGHAHLHDGHRTHLQGDFQGQRQEQRAERGGHVGHRHLWPVAPQAQVQGRRGRGRTLGLPRDRAWRPRKPSDAGHPRFAGARGSEGEDRRSRPDPTVRSRRRSPAGYAARRGQ